MTPRHEGFSMIEVLITIAILMVGLLGLAMLQSKALTAQMEAYQRSQALILLKDMENRINANRKHASVYVTTSWAPPALGTAAVCPASTGNAIADADLCEWHNALLGAAESSGGSNVGAMIGARGCVEQIAPAASGVPGQYLVSIAWQGFNSTIVPALSCGQNAYGPDDALRRVVALPVSIADLD